MKLNWCRSPRLQFSLLEWPNSGVVFSFQTSQRCAVQQPTHHCCPCCRSVGARGPHVAWPSAYAGWRQYNEITGRGGWRSSHNAWSRPRQSHPPRHLTTLARCCTGPLSRRLVWTAKLSCDDLTPSWHQAVRAPPDGWRPCCWLSEAYSVLDGCCTLEGGYVLTAAATAAGGIMPSSKLGPRSTKVLEAMMKPAVWPSTLLGIGPWSKGY